MAGDKWGDGRGRCRPSHHGGPSPGRCRVRLSDAAETLTIAGLIERYFGAEFSLDRLSHVLGMLAAAVIGTCVSGIGGVAASVLLQPSGRGFNLHLAFDFLDQNQR